MHKKYFFFDYDGTLAAPLTQTIPDSALEAIRRLRQAGHFVGLATGRLQANALDYVQSCGITTLVADGGNSVTLDGKLVWMESMPVGPCKDLLHRLDVQGIPWAVMTENVMCRYSRSEAFEMASSDAYAPTVVAPDLSIDSLSTIYKMFVPLAPEDEHVVDFGSVSHTRYDAQCVFCEPTDKSIGIKKLCDIIGAPYKDVDVFGDGYNDLNMFIPEWTSIAMGNGRESLKQKADYVTSRYDEDGILRAVEHFGWI